MIDIIAKAPEAHANESALQGDLPHILFVVDQFGKTLGGGERIVLKVAALLPQYGYRASILTLSAHPDSAALKAPPCSIFLLPLQNSYNLTALRAAFELRRFLKQQRIQIVHTFFESSDIWGGLVTKTMSKAKLVWARRDMGILRSRKHQIAYRLMAGMPDAVFAVSEQVRRHSIEVDRIDPACVQTIYNGLNLEDWDMAPRPVKAPDEYLVTTVGNIRRVKGHDVLIRAAAAVVKSVSQGHVQHRRGCAGGGLFRRAAISRQGFEAGQSFPIRWRSYKSASTSCRCRYFRSSLAQRGFLQCNCRGHGRISSGCRNQRGRKPRGR